MNRVLGIEKISDIFVLICDFESDIGKPMGFRLHNSNGDMLEINEYKYERFTQCFSTKESNPSIVTRTIIPDSFFQSGSLIEKIV